MDHVALLLFVAAAALLLFVLFQWLRGRRRATPPRFEAAPRPPQFGKAHIPDTSVGYAAAQRAMREFRPLADMPAPPQAEAAPAAREEGNAH
jgi:hypothetical protein